VSTAWFWMVWSFGAGSFTCTVRCSSTTSGPTGRSPTNQRTDWTSDRSVGHGPKPSPVSHSTVMPAGSVSGRSTSVVWVGMSSVTTTPVASSLPLLLSASVYAIVSPGSTIVPEAGTDDL